MGGRTPPRGDSRRDKTQPPHFSENRSGRYSRIVGDISLNTAYVFVNIYVWYVYMYISTCVCIYIRETSSGEKQITVVIIY